MSQFMTDRDEISAWLKDQWVRKFAIKADGIVDVAGSVDLSGHRLKLLPVRFGQVDGDFNINGNPLISLEGAPRRVGSNCFCSTNQIQNLKGAPDWVAEDFAINDLPNLTSLDGMPGHVGGFIYVNAKRCKDILRFMMVDGLRGIMSISGNEMRVVIRHMEQKHDIFACQQELIEAGFEEYATL